MALFHFRIKSGKKPDVLKFLPSNTLTTFAVKALFTILTLPLQLTILAVTLFLLLKLKMLALDL